MTDRAIHLVDVGKLRELLKKLELGDPQRNAHLEARWLQYVDWWDSRASKAKSKYLGLRSTVVASVVSAGRSAAPLSE